MLADPPTAPLSMPESQAVASPFLSKFLDWRTPSAPDHVARQLIFMLPSLRGLFRCCKVRRKFPQTRMMMRIMVWVAAFQCVNLKS